MATSSVQAALGTPEIVRCIDSCTQLLPGVPASTQNIQPSWEHISETKSWSTYDDDVLIAMVNYRRKKGALHVNIEGPVEPIANDLPGAWHTHRALVNRKSFDWSIDGLVEALAYAKHIADRVRRKDFCSRCRIDGLKKNASDELVKPVKELKAHPLPYCAECMLDLATGGPPQKKARH